MGKFKETILKLLFEHSSPSGIALGTAIGVFIAILPVYGLHTVLVIVAAILVRPANKVAILLGTNISLPPTLPFITWAGYELGRFVLRGDIAPLAWTDFKNITFEKVAKLYPTLFLGSIILGIILAIITYFLVFFITRKFKMRTDAARV
ncbi:MAG: DUF2062 domain-containing protein [Candidatus Omnitrophica bacterium]|nr:DUF2062 domain-containing protein [Candidatus Omnitrophota bacterium]